MQRSRHDSSARVVTTVVGPRSAGHRTTAPDAAKPFQLAPSVLLVAVGAGAALVVWIWWKNTTSIDGLGGWLTNAGRITGLLAGYSIACLLGLMARVPALERGIGTDRLTRWHAMGGRYTISLLVAHALLITWGYAVTAREGVVGQGLAIVKTYPDMIAATIGTGILVLVGIVSARIARRRLPYEIWHLVHLGTYVGAYLVFAHQFSNGADLHDDITAQAFWYTLYGVVGSLLIWFRAIRPIWHLIRYRIKVWEVQFEGPGVVSVYMTGTNLTDLKAKPGQFFRFHFLTRHGWWAANPYSLSAPLAPDLMRITVKDQGSHSGRLANLQPGTRVFIEGPYGGFTGDVRRQRKVLLIGAGVGITPVRALFESLPGGPGDLTLIYRASQSDEVVLHQEIDRIANARGAYVHYLVGSRAELGGDPLDAATLSHLVPHLEHHEVYICGPDGMANATIRALRQAGVPRRRIHHESFTF